MKGLQAPVVGPVVTSQDLEAGWDEERVVTGTISLSPEARVAHTPVYSHPLPHTPLTSGQPREKVIIICVWTLTKFYMRRD